MTKRELLEIVGALPEEASESYDKIASEIERIRFMESVDRGLDQLDRGEKIPHAKVKKKIAEWLKR